MNRFTDARAIVNEVLSQHTSHVLAQLDDLFKAGLLKCTKLEPQFFHSAQGKFEFTSPLKIECIAQDRVNELQRENEKLRARLAAISAAVEDLL